MNQALGRASDKAGEEGGKETKKSKMKKGKKAKEERNQDDGCHPYPNLEFRKYPKLESRKAKEERNQDDGCPIPEARILKNRVLELGPDIFIQVKMRVCETAIQRRSCSAASA